MWFSYRAPAFRGSASVFNSQRRRLQYCCLLSISLALVFGDKLAAQEKNSAHVDYMLNCQGCHLPGGIGHPGIVPNLANEMGRFLASDIGRAYLVQVPGAAQSSLSNEQLARVINWMLREFDPARVDENFIEFNAAEVARYRYVAPSELSALRRRILETHDAKVSPPPS